MVNSKKAERSAVGEKKPWWKPTWLKVIGFLTFLALLGQLSGYSLKDIFSDNKKEFTKGNTLPKSDTTKTIKIKQKDQEPPSPSSLKRKKDVSIKTEGNNSPAIYNEGDDADIKIEYNGLDKKPETKKDTSIKKKGQ